MLYTRVLKKHGWVASKVMAGIFHHKDPSGTCGCHGDDFLAEGGNALLDKLDNIMSQEFEAKLLGRVGCGQLAEAKSLKRTLRWHEEEASFTWSGGVQYVEELVTVMGLENDRAVTKVTKTPGTKATGASARDALELVNDCEAGTYKTAVGMIGYIVLDRPECQYSAKEVMSMVRGPRKLDWMRLVRMTKFLASHPELEWVFEAQDMPTKFVVYGDSDWAGGESRRSTSGTAEVLGKHTLEFSCSTQHVIALSSGEAELYATGRAAAGGLQTVQLLHEAGLPLELEVLTDSTANLGMHGRKGSGKVRHLEVRWLWTQEAVQAKRFALKKVSTDTNISDLTTKYHDEQRLVELLRLAGLRFSRGLIISSLLAAGAEGAKTRRASATMAT